jgi:hypothetical protein
VHLEDQPLPDLGALLERYTDEFACGVKLFSDIEKDCAGFSDDMVLVCVFDEGGETSVSKGVCEIVGRTRCVLACHADGLISKKSGALTPFGPSPNS